MINNTKKQIRKAKKITNQEDIKSLSELTVKDITLSFIMKNFGEFEGKRKYNAYDEIVIPKGMYKMGKFINDNEIQTTVGKLLFNRYFITENLMPIFGYINDDVTKKKVGKMLKTLSYSTLEDKITLDDVKLFEKKTQKFQPYVSILAENHSLYLLTSEKEFEKKKKEIYKKYEKAIQNGDELAMHRVEQEMLKYADEYMKDDPSMDSYNSGARGSFGNNFKNMFLLKGLYNSPDPNEKPMLLMSNYMQGIDKKEYAAFANSLSAGPFSRAINTANGGHMEKIFINAFQHIVLDKEGSDCGTQRTKKVLLTENNIDLWMYSFMKINGRLIELNSDNADKYIGKTVNFRFSQFCESKTGICNKCIGNLYYKLGIRNLGMGSAQLASKLKLLSMKSFHQSTIEFYEIDVEKAFGM